jgi:hypothetical protein
MSQFTKIGVDAVSDGIAADIQADKAQSPRRFDFGQIFERIANRLRFGGGSAFR